MTVAELMHHNFDEIFIELDPVKREAMMRIAYTEDCVKIAYGYTRVAAWSALRRSMRQRRKFVSASRSTATRWLAIFTRCTMSGCAVGGADFHQPFRYTGTDVLEERDGRVAVFYTFIDSGSPPVSSTE